MIELPYRPEIVIPEFKIYRDTELLELNNLLRFDSRRLQDVNLKIENHCHQLLDYKRILTKFTGEA